MHDYIAVAFLFRVKNQRLERISYNSIIEKTISEMKMNYQYIFTIFCHLIFRSVIYIHLNIFMFSIFRLQKSLSSFCFTRQKQEVGVRIQNIIAVTLKKLI